MYPHDDIRDYIRELRRRKAERRIEIIMVIGWTVFIWLLFLSK